MKSNKETFASFCLTGLILLFAYTIFSTEDTLLIFLIHYLLYLASLVYLTVIFYTERIKGNKKSEINWTIASILVAWTISADLALPTYQSDTLSLLKTLFYTMILIGYQNLVLEFVSSSLNKYMLTGIVLLLSVNFLVYRVNWNIYKNLLSERSPLVSFLVNETTVSILVTLLIIYAFIRFYVNEQNKKYTFSKYYLLFSSTVVLLFSTTVAMNAFNISLKIDLQTLPSKYYNNVYIPLFLYVSSFGFINDKHKSLANIIFAVSFLAFYIAQHESNILDAIQTVIEFQEGTGKYVTYVIGLLGLVTTIASILEMAKKSEKEKKKNTTSA